jgi:hypothetical protein
MSETAPDSFPDFVLGYWNLFGPWCLVIDRSGDGGGTDDLAG